MGETSGKETTQTGEASQGRGVGAPTWKPTYVTATRTGLKRIRIPPMGCDHMATAAGGRQASLLEMHHAEVAHTKRRGM